MKVVNREARIDYRLNLLGIRVSKDAAQLIARWRGDEWSTIGAQRELPIRFPLTPSELNDVAGGHASPYSLPIRCGTSRE